MEQRTGGEKTRRPQPKAEAVLFPRPDDAAGAAIRFEDTHGDSCLLKMIGAGEAGNPSANDNRWKRSHRRNGHENLDPFFRASLKTAAGFPVVVFQDRDRKPWRYGG